MFTWTRLQGEAARWKQKNFPESPTRHQVEGCIEEFGELTHAKLKAEQGIRGSVARHEAAGRDAIADSLIYFVNVCDSLGWSANKVLRSESPKDFQSTFAAPPKRSPLAHALTNLARMSEALEDLERASTAIEKDSYTEAAQMAALRYISGLAAYCTSCGWNLQEIIEEVWPRVRARDWTKNKLTGGDLEFNTKKEIEVLEDEELLKHLDPARLAGVIAVANLEPIKKMEMSVTEKVTDAFVEALDERAKKKRNG